MLVTGIINYYCTAAASVRWCRRPLQSSVVAGKARGCLLFGNLYCASCPSCLSSAWGSGTLWMLQLMAQERARCEEMVADAGCWRCSQSRREDVSWAGRPHASHADELTPPAILDYSVLTIL